MVNDVLFAVWPFLSFERTSVGNAVSLHIQSKSTREKVKHDKKVRQAGAELGQAQPNWDWVRIFLGFQLNVKFM